MLTMAVGHSDDVDAADAIAIAIDQGRAQLGGLAPQAGVLVAAFDSFGPSLVAAVREAFPGSRSSAGHVAAAADLAIAMRAAVEEVGPPWQIRIGIHNGPVVAGVIGTSKFVYDLWGDAVKVAIRLEATSQPGRIQVSESVAAGVGDRFTLEPRGAIDLKGKGSTATFFLSAAPPSG